jgi:hypothetical protein
MRTSWILIGIAALAIAAALLWPLSAALGPTAVRASRLTAVLASLAICGLAAIVPSRLQRMVLVWVIAALLSFAGAASLLFMHIRASGSCVAEYDDRLVVVGRQLQSWVKPEPGATSKSLLFDSAGEAERAWTRPSIARCRWLLEWAAMLAVPLFAFAGASGFHAMQQQRYSSVLSKPGALSTRRGDFAYDAFISYRRVEPDRTFALDLLSQLEATGLRVAIDIRDFVPNRHFLSEMERCSKESRFVLCVITPAYIASDHCLEEAVLSKTMDMSERRQRIVPLILEPVELPVWLHGIVGIDFTPESAVDPYARLLTLLTAHTA